MNTKILKDLTLFAKYVSLKKAVGSIGVNVEMVKYDMIAEHLVEGMTYQNKCLMSICEELTDIAETHKGMFLSETKELVKDDGTPSDYFRNIYLAVIHMSGGDITGCLTFLNDLIAVSYEKYTLSQQIQMSIDYTRELVKDGYVTPQVLVIADDGRELGREDMDEIDGDVEVTRVKLTLSDLGKQAVPEVIEELDEKREKLTKELADHFALMKAESPSRMLN